MGIPAGVRFSAGRSVNEKFFMHGLTEFIYKGMDDR